MVAGGATKTAAYRDDGIVWNHTTTRSCPTQDVEIRTLGIQQMYQSRTTATQEGEYTARTPDHLAQEQATCTTAACRYRSSFISAEHLETSRAWHLKKALSRSKENRAQRWRSNATTSVTACSPEPCPCVCKGGHATSENVSFVAMKLYRHGNTNAHNHRNFTRQHATGQESLPDCRMLLPQKAPGNHQGRTPDG